VERPLDESTSRELLFQALNCLNDRERSIITMRFGLGGGQERTQKEIADVMGISQSYISRLEKRIILRLRRELEKIG
jgi:RNA polymerase sporulation-specific sigma factor